MKTIRQRAILEIMEDLSWHFHITGQVQGVGFRPHVFRIANRNGIKGWVSNNVDGVHIECSSTSQKAELFLNEIVETAPIQAHITSASKRNIAFKTFSEFTILHNPPSFQTHINITPDFALCNECKSELREGRRKDYPFISCTTCGPRFSILKSLPFDRPFTSMSSFDLCDSCLSEYKDHSDRRFYAQTISCPDCQIKLELLTQERDIISTDTSKILSLIPSLWKEGKIIAIKGIGGFLLTCDAMHVEAVNTVRDRKHRPAKPFAVMIPSLDIYPKLKTNSLIKQALEGSISPIVLCPKDQISHDFKNVANDLDKIGIMLPYAPLFQLLLDTFQQPIIATSGNVSNSPIIFKNEEAVENLSSIADYILINNRVILMPQDDSLITFAQNSNQKIILRRSRGIAPNGLETYHGDVNETVLCLGAEMKSSFCISHQRNIHISQYIGNLSNYDTQNRFSYMLNHFLSIIQISPTHICIDAHPGYFTNQYAAELSKELKIPITTIQHHKAHFASILGEHKLLDSNEKILGVIWDGTGLGDDGMIWGSEFFIYENHNIKRSAHLEYYTHFLHEKMATEPRISAFAILHSDENSREIIREKFSAEEWKIYTHLIKKENKLQTSSMGRLFDAVASILGLIDKQTYEGEAAMLLEVSARRHISVNSIENINSYNYKNTVDQNANPKRILGQVIEDLNAKKSIELIAAKFHLTLVNWIIDQAKLERCTSLAFSGGVFQNSVLVDLIHLKCTDDFSLYFHSELSPNDENISFGQYIYYKLSKKLTEKS